MSSYPSEYQINTEGSGKFSLADTLFKYIAYLPLFIISLIVSIVSGVIYLRYTNFKYTATIPLLIKAGSDDQISGGRQGDLVQIALYGPEQINMSNEVEKLKSVKTFRRMVEKQQFNISYFNEGNIKTSNLYHEVPFRLLPLHISDSSASYTIRFTSLTTKGYTLISGKDQKQSHLWSDVLSVGGSQFRLQPVELIGDRENILYIATWVNPTNKAREILSQLTFTPKDAGSAIVNISIKNDNALLGRAILNSLVTELNLANIEAKNLAKQNVIRFIEERVDSLGKELATLELHQDAVKGKQDFLSLDQQSTLYMGKLEETERLLDGLDLQINLADMVNTYVQAPATKNKIVPSSLGITDVTVTGMIAAYNQLQLQREKEAPNLPVGGMLMQQMDSQLAEIRKSIIESLTNFKKATEHQKADIINKNSAYKNYLGGIPEKARRQVELERQRNVKENLYLYLLQKKEETAISTAATSANYEQLNEASGSLQPVEPDAGKIHLFTVMLGLLLPVGIIYLREQLNQRVYTREDITRKTRIPIVGEIGHAEDSRSLVVVHQSRSIISEQFRAIRSNLSFFEKHQEIKTILVTSSVSGEGKSFVSINMAAVLALAGKKVALLEFDLRKPRILTNLSIAKTGQGISNFLMGDAKAEDILTPLENFPDLHIYPSGIVPANPAELMLSSNNDVLFSYLKANYDYVIIDSAPVGLVSDTFTLAKYVDISLYIVRHRFTFKRQVSFTNEIYQQQKLPNLYLVINDLKAGAHFGYYGYGKNYTNGYYYGYGNANGFGAEGYYDVEPGRWKRLTRRKRKP